MSTPRLVILMALLLVILGAVYAVRTPTRSGVAVDTAPVASTTAAKVMVSDVQHYFDAEYGFSLTHPRSIRATTTPPALLSEGTFSGEPLAAFVLPSSGESAHAAFVVGVHANTEDCMVPTDTHAATSTVVIHSTPFTTWTSRTENPSRYLHVRTYRTVYHGMCYLLDLRVGNTALSTTGEPPRGEPEAFMELSRIMGSFQFGDVPQGS